MLDVVENTCGFAHLLHLPLVVKNAVVLCDKLAPPLIAFGNLVQNGNNVRREGVDLLTGRHVGASTKAGHRNRHINQFDDFSHKLLGHDRTVF